VVEKFVAVLPRDHACGIENSSSAVQ
jgi:hypothetical protein